MFDLPVGWPSELVPLSWLIGVWEGSGVLEYQIGDESVSRTFGHRISFSHDGLPHLNYSSYTWLEPEAPAASSETDADVLDPALSTTSLSTSSLSASNLSTSRLSDELLSGDKLPLVTETGYWRLSRHQGDGDPGPGMLPGTGERPFTSAAAVETLRNRDGGFDIEVTLVHPGGVAELYLGQVKGPRIDLATDAVLRTGGAKPYAAATRLYGLVDNHLLWAWDIAALGQDLRTHSSGRLARVE